jgi:dachs
MFFLYFDSNSITLTYLLSQTNVGPILLSINPYQDLGNPLTLSSTRSISMSPQLTRIVQETVRQQAETGYPQAIILSGEFH